MAAAAAPKKKNRRRPLALFGKAGRQQREELLAAVARLQLRKDQPHDEVVAQAVADIERAATFARTLDESTKQDVGTELIEIAKHAQRLSRLAHVGLTKKVAVLRGIGAQLPTAEAIDRDVLAELFRMHDHDNAAYALIADFLGVAGPDAITASPRVTPNASSALLAATRILGTVKWDEVEHEGRRLAGQMTQRNRPKRGRGGVRISAAEQGLINALAPIYQHATAKLPASGRSDFPSPFERFATDVAVALKMTPRPAAIAAAVAHFRAR